MWAPSLTSFVLQNHFVSSPSILTNSGLWSKVCLLFAKVNPSTCSLDFTTVLQSMVKSPGSGLKPCDFRSSSTTLPVWPRSYSTFLSFCFPTCKKWLITVPTHKANVKHKWENPHKVLSKIPSTQSIFSNIIAVNTITFPSRYLLVHFPLSPK